MKKAFNRVVVAVGFFSYFLSGSGYAGVDPADQAVAAAKKYSGITLNIVYEAGLQTHEALHFSGPLWEKLTGIKINVVPVALGNLYNAYEAEFIKQSAYYDILNVIPSFMADLIQFGALEPLDGYLERFDYKQELKEISPAYRDNWMHWRGRVYGIPDDGDALVFYYRLDLFEDAVNQKVFRERYGYALAPPKTWRQFDDISAFFSQQYAPNIYGSAIPRDTHTFYFFEEQFRANGGRFFNEATMEATINSPIGVATLEAMVKRHRHMPPGSEKWGAMEILGAFMQGKIAMTEFWPPLGRWCEGYGAETKQLSWLPKSTIAGKVGYAVPPGGHSEMAIGYTLSISADSKHKEAAYLYIQWLTSRRISLQRVMLPFALRDPYRLSHYNNDTYRHLWPNAPSYLETLANIGRKGLPDLSIIQTNKYEQLLNRGLNAAITGRLAPQSALDQVALQWDRLTKGIGVDKQRHAYTHWMSHPNAYPK